MQTLPGSTAGQGMDYCVEDEGDWISGSTGICREGEGK